MYDRAAQRIGSPAAGFDETRWLEIIVSTNGPPHPHAEGGQMEPVLGRRYSHYFAYSIMSHMG
jgi:hypothetical protein